MREIGCKKQSEVINVDEVKVQVVDKAAGWKDREINGVDLKEKRKRVQQDLLNTMRKQEGADSEVERPDEINEVVI